MTDPKTYIDPAEEKMEMAVAYLEETLQRIRAGKANPKILDAVRVEYYGSLAPISNVANVSVPDARTIVITPWEKAMFKPIEKAILNSEVGITPENNGEVIRLTSAETRSTVIRSRDLPVPKKSRNCLGMAVREKGQKREPTPPHMMTQ